MAIRMLSFEASQALVGRKARAGIANERVEKDGRGGVDPANP